MKLFQIEEPDGAPLDRDGPGAAVGIDLMPGPVGRVATALAGNAELLPDGDGVPVFALGAGTPLADLLLTLRSAAEKQLARPVTHAVIAAALERAVLERAASAAGLTILKVMSRAEAAALAKGAPADDAAALGAAIAAEDLAPVPED